MDIIELSDALTRAQHSSATHLLTILTARPYPEDGLSDGSFGSILRLAGAAGITSEEIAREQNQPLPTIELWKEGTYRPGSIIQNQMVSWLIKRLERSTQ